MTSESPVRTEILAGRGNSPTSDSRDENSGGLVLGYQIVLLAHFYVDRPCPRHPLSCLVGPRQPSTVRRQGCDFLDFLVAAARSFHFFYSLARFSYPASLAVGRRVVVTAASRPNVTSMQIAMHACPR